MALDLTPDWPLDLQPSVARQVEATTAFGTDLHDIDEGELTLF